ncbi:unannotated protein [freshwater metagenome]|uniref:Unannotated protein n=1 Tax=freshwater metagenome TaxID=449393 RepID=A0A6J6WTQ0_9ZZZZ
MATRSSPMVSYLPIARAISVFVPTPSVDVASRGCFISLRAEASKRPANPPMPPITSGRDARAIDAFINSTARSPASISTPESLYVAITSQLSFVNLFCVNICDFKAHLALGHICWNCNWVLAREACATELLFSNVSRFNQTFLRYVSE